MRLYILLYLTHNSPMPYYTTVLQKKLYNMLTVHVQDYFYQFPKFSDIVRYLPKILNIPLILQNMPAHLFSKTAAVDDKRHIVS